MAPAPSAARWLAALRDVVFPRTCLVCGLPAQATTAADTAQDAVCAPCLEELPWNLRACPLCAAPTDGGQEEECVACELAPPAWDHALAPLRYAPPVDTLIRRLKFHASVADGRWLAAALALALQAGAAEDGWPDLLIPVPMHPRRRALRGFNHAAFLAQALVDALPTLRLDSRSLQRTRWTPAQARLDAHARRRNLIDALRWRGPPPPPRVAVVDDVLTTGSTATAVTRTLREAGVQEVQIWTCARAGRLRRTGNPGPDR